HDATLTPLFQLSSLIIPAFAAASFYFYYFTGLHFFRLQAFLKTMRSLGRILFIVGLAFFFGVPGAISGYIVAPLFVFAIALLCDIVITHRYFPHVKQTKGNVIDFSGKTILAYAWPLTLFLLFYEFILTLDLYFVKSLLQSDTLTGIYNAAITVGRIPYYLFYALTIILLPAISKSTAERNTEETESLVNKSLRLMTLILFPLVTLIIIYSTQILRIFYGAKYLEASAPMNVYTIGVGFLTVFYVLAFALNGANLVKIPMKLAFFGFLGMILLNFLLIPQWQLVGAALSTTIVSLLLMIAILIYTKKHFNVHIPLRTFFFSILTSCIITFIARYCPDGSWEFIFSGTALFIIYFILLKIMGELEASDWEPFTKIFAKK
ncbi:MAG: polysaccharide biosynthesis C-terminal domain-containing protein, partial [Candidatus Moraniibacteriota bacterium]